MFRHCLSKNDILIKSVCQKHTYLLQDTSVGLVDLLNHPGHHGVYTISLHLFLRPNYCPH